MRLIDADDAVKRLREAERGMKVVSVVGCKAIDFAVVPRFIEGMPTIDAVPVVRCKDCAEYYKGKCDNVLGSPNPYPESFCSFGERRSDA